MNNRWEESPPGFRQLWPHYLLSFALWLVASGLSVWTLIAAREAVLSLLPLVGPWVMIGLDKASFVVFGLAALVWIMFAEDYLRSGIAAGDFWRRVRRVAVAQIALLAFVFAAQVFIRWWA